MKDIACGCGEYAVYVENDSHIYQFGAICPSCGNPFGFDASDELDEFRESRDLPEPTDIADVL